MALAQTEPKKGGVFRVGIGHGSSTDGYDPGLWDQLFVQTFAATGLTAQHAYALMRNSFEASFLAPAAKRTMLERVDAAFLG